MANLYESYPESDVQALAPSTLDKRLPYKWLEDNYLEKDIIDVVSMVDFPIFIPGLRIMELPLPGEQYRGGADPAAGNPTADDSAFSLLHRDTGKQVAVFNGKYEPGTFAEYIAKLAKVYNNAPVLVERNNHGHAVIMGCELLRVKLLDGPDDKTGYLSNKRTKVQLYDHFADSLKTDDILITDFETFNQLALIEGNTLSAPEGEEDDLADSIALADIARTLKVINASMGSVALGKAKGWTPNAKRSNR